MIVYPASFLGTQVSGFRFSSTPLSWPSSTTGYTQYSGGIIPANAFANGRTGAFFLPFNLIFNGTSSISTNNIYITTNGQFNGGLLVADISVNEPTIGNGLYPQYSLNASTSPNLKLQPGAPMADGDIQGVWSQTGSISGPGNKKYAKYIVFCEVEGDPMLTGSYLFNLYKDDNFQWMETRVKNIDTVSFAGPYMATPVYQSTSTISNVWRAAAPLFTNWVHVGSGSVVE